jgi:hypothetical protein
LLLPVIWLVAEQRPQRARVAHTTGLGFIAVLLVVVRQMRMRKVGSPLDDTLSQRELPHSRHTGTLQATRIAAHVRVRAVPLELLSCRLDDD